MNPKQLSRHQPPSQPLPGQSALPGAGQAPQQHQALAEAPPWRGLQAEPPQGSEQPLVHGARPGPARIGPGCARAGPGPEGGGRRRGAGPGPSRGGLAQGRAGLPAGGRLWLLKIH